MRKHIVSLGLVTLIGALASPGLAADLKRITKENDFRATVVGHKYVSEKGDWIVISADGTLTGKFSKKKLVGAWNWQGKFWCRNIVLDGKKLGSDCQEIHANATQMRSKRQKGKGDWASLMTRK